MRRTDLMAEQRARVVQPVHQRLHQLILCRGMQPNAPSRPPRRQCCAARTWPCMARQSNARHASAPVALEERPRLVQQAGAQLGHGLGRAGRRWVHRQVRAGAGVARARLQPLEAVDGDLHGAPQLRKIRCTNLACLCNLGSRMRRELAKQRQHGHVADRTKRLARLLASPVNIERAAHLVADHGVLGLVLQRAAALGVSRREKRANLTRCGSAAGSCICPRQYAHSCFSSADSSCNAAAVNDGHTMWRRGSPAAMAVTDASHTMLRSVNSARNRSASGLRGGDAVVADSGACDA